MKQIISTNLAPQAIGTYSQAVKVGNAVYISGQIPMDPETGEVVEGDFKTHVERAFQNLAAVVEAAGGAPSDIVKLTVYLTDMANFQVVNEVMGARFTEPYPARAVVAVKALPKAVDIELDAILSLGE